MALFGPPNIEKMKAKRDVPGLFKLMLANKGELCEKAKQALVEIGPDAVLPLAREMQSFRGPAQPIAEFVGVVAAMGAPAVPALVAVTLAGLGVRATYLATLTLGAVGGGEATTALQAIAEAGKKLSASVNSLATGFVRDPSSAQVRLPLLFGLQWTYLMAGTMSDAVLAHMGGRGVAISISALQMSSERNVREFMAGELGIVGDRQATPALLRLLEDTDTDARRVAALGLGLMGDPAAIASLNERLRDRDPAVRAAASLALTAIQASALGPAAAVDNAPAS